VDALFAVIERPATDARCLDIGSGVPTTIHELACALAAMCGAPEPIVVGRFRDGDVRAAQCDIDKTKEELDWQPAWALDDGLRALLDWIGEQHSIA
jgi:dTDP-L-rhamnose 4-epimerase